MTHTGGWLWLLRAISSEKEGKIIESIRCFFVSKTSSGLFPAGFKIGVLHVAFETLFT